MSEYIAISPSRNDQWSGKTLFMLLRRKVAEPNRSSTVRRPFLVAASAGLLMRSTTLPEARAHRHVVRHLRDEVAVGVDVELHLRQPAGGRTEDDVRVVGHVERRLVAGTQQVVRLLLVEADRAARVRADLRVGHVVELRPGELLLRPDLVRAEADQHGRRERELLRRREAGRHHGLDAADLEVAELHRLPGGRVDQSLAGLPPAVAQLLGRERAEVLQQYDGRQRQDRDNAEQRAAQDLATAETGGPEALEERLLGEQLLFLGGVQRMALLDRLVVREQLLRPEHETRAEREQRDREATTERVVHQLPEPLVLRNDEVGDTRPERRERCQREQPGDLHFRELLL